jgi:hypothetical protein
MPGAKQIHFVSVFDFSKEYSGAISLKKVGDGKKCVIAGSLIKIQTRPGVYSQTAEITGSTLPEHSKKQYFVNCKSKPTRPEHPRKGNGADQALQSRILAICAAGHRACTPGHPAALPGTKNGGRPYFPF